eukprot:TRINITY_DN17440_c0_g1_i1.p1 TRINITY_DN17440_c0_g1~~TRINITY_DN17440_c0_g1_i1.p1  ORF type:complete len:324 (-),score=50.34 TRINITY_DN17440_c0_g1_i1:184-1155(-)
MESTEQTYFCPAKTYTQKSLMWKFPKTLGGYTLHGNSWSCNYTAFQIPELGWSLDCGFIAHPQWRTHMFLTHAHGDHSTALPFIISRHIPPTIYIPEEAADSCRSYLDNYVNFRLHGQDIDVRLPTFFIEGVRSGTKFKLSGKAHGDKVVEVFKCYHSVPCVGYGFSQEKKRLKPEYSGFQGRQLGELRRKGVTIDQFYEAPMFAFMGDTTVEFYAEQAELEKKNEPNVFRYPLIITECTFLGTGDTDEVRAYKTKHTVWTLLKPFVVSHPQITFVLIHFSMRNTEQEIRSFFTAENVKNVVAFVESEDASVLQQVVQNVEDY